MKILIFRTDPSIMNVSSYNSQEIGLAKAYIAKGHQCDIVYYNGKNKSYVENIDAGQGKTIKLYWWKGFSILNNGIFPGIAKLLEQYDMVQVSEYYQWSSWYVYSRYGRKKKVYVYQGVYDADNSKKYRLRCKVMDPILLNRRVLRETQIFTKSNLALDSMKHRGFEKVETVGVGLDISRFETLQSDSQKNTLFTKEDGLSYLLYVGVLEERRNILFMLDVLKKVVDKNEKVRLVVIGKGQSEYVAQCKEKVQKLGLEKYIIYKERMPQNELAPIYRECDVFLLPTKYEIFGMVLLEAMLFDLAVITSYNGGSSTIIKDEENGYIVPQFDECIWSEKIIEILTKGEKNEITNDATRTVMEQFSWDSIAGQILEKL